VRFNALASSLVVACATTVTAAPLVVVSHSAIYDVSTKQVHFTVVALAPPDFYTVDRFGRQKDSFQFYLNTEVGVSQWERIVRGGEISAYAAVPIRDTTGWFPTGEHAGGWGSIVDIVPYTLTGTTVTLSYSFASIKTLTGQFAYDLLGTSYGASSGSILHGQSQPASIPTPGVTGVFIGGALWRSRRRSSIDPHTGDSTPPAGAHRADWASHGRMIVDTHVMGATR